MMEDTKIHLCNTCIYTIPECSVYAEDLEFGDGLGNDNIIKCPKHQTEVES